MSDRVGGTCGDRGGGLMCLHAVMAIEPSKGCACSLEGFDTQSVCRLRLELGLGVGIGLGLGLLSLPI